MTLLNWPAITDSPDGQTGGTEVSKAVMDDIRAAIEDVVHSTVNPTITPADIIDEVEQARGVSSSLSQRLAVLQAAPRFSTTVASASNSGTSETFVHSHTLLGGYLDENGDMCVLRAFGVFAANSNNKRVRVFFGGSAIDIAPSAAYNGYSWELELRVYRVTATTQRAVALFRSGKEGLASFSHVLADITLAETLSGDVTVKLGLTSGTGSNDITCYASDLSLA